MPVAKYWMVTYKFKNIDVTKTQMCYTTRLDWFYSAFKSGVITELSMVPYVEIKMPGFANCCGKCVSGYCVYPGENLQAADNNLKADSNDEKTNMPGLQFDETRGEKQALI